MKLTFPEQFDWIKEEFNRTGLWEPKTTKYIEDHLKKGQTFVDIGANVGYYSIIAAKLGAKVLAFEPSSNNRKFLEKNIKDNKCDVKVFSQALSNENGSAMLNTDTTPGQYSIIGNSKVEQVELLAVENPKVSIIIPNFNYAKYIGEAIESAQNQTHPAYEIIVVDDGSTDNSKEVIEKYDVIKIYTSNHGVASAKNIGARQATGDYLIFLDSDDKLASDYIEETLKEMKGNVQIVYTDMELIGDDSGIRCYADFSLEELKRNMNLPGACVLIDKRVFDLVEGFDKDEWYDDYGLWLRIATKGYNFKHIAKPLFQYRKHGKSLTDVRSVKDEEGLNQLRLKYGNLGNSKGEKVETIKYDDLNLPISDFYKLDCEGSERQVLECMQSVLNTDKPITLIIEDWKNDLADWLIRTYGFNLAATERMYQNKILTKNQPFTYTPEPFRIHLLSLPHTETTGAYSWCAFTALVTNMATMMTRQGHKVFLYAGESNEAECFEHINCSGKPKSTNFFVPPWTYEYFKPMNDKIIEEMRKRIRCGDIILQSTSLQSVVPEAFPGIISMEYAIGYGGCKSACRVFPCEAWRHEIYGRDAAARGEDIHTVMGYSSDAVIPHFFNVEQFPEGKGDGGYLLFVGRLGGMKGEQVAVEASKRTGIPLKLIGPGTPPDYGEYLGVMQPKERAELMGGAIAVIAPSMFPEPFNMVAVEAQMCGTPMITTDWGGFTETVENGVSGYRCSTINEFAQAVLDCQKLDRKKVRERAIRMYSFDAIGPQYTKFFHRLEEIMPK